MHTEVKEPQQKSPSSQVYRVQRVLLRAIPSFRGSWLVHSRLFKVVPSKQRLFPMADPSILLDLSDPPQFSIAKTRGGALEPATTRFLKERLHLGDVFIDVGANWGYFVCVAAQAVGPAGIVIAIEPMRKTFSRLLETVARCNANAVTFNAAAGERMHEEIHFSKPWFRQSTSAHAGGGHHSVRTITLDWLGETINVRPGALGVIKIDVEGAELFVLRGARNLLRKHRPAVIAECAGLNERFRYSFAQLCEFMQNCGYEPTLVLNDYGDGSTTLFEAASFSGGQVVFEHVGGVP
ncbi:MAG: FkbM family methyltransferase [Actinomycetota bacterium]